MKQGDVEPAPSAFTPGRQNMSEDWTDEQYEHALRRIWELMDAKRGTPEGDELDKLADQAVAYEEKHHPIERPS